jgi:hypothetical protein
MRGKPENLNGETREVPWHTLKWVSTTIIDVIRMWFSKNHTGAVNPNCWAVYPIIIPATDPLVEHGGTFSIICGIVWQCCEFQVFTARKCQLEMDKYPTISYPNLESLVFLASTWTSISLPFFWCAARNFKCYQYVGFLCKRVMSSNQAHSNPPLGHRWLHASGWSRDYVNALGVGTQTRCYGLVDGGCLCCIWKIHLVRLKRIEFGSH